jgi:UDP-N-acetylglucosamine 2-epimerase (hydrolysing)
MKGLIGSVEKSSEFECFVFATGMHMMKKYGFTFVEIAKQEYKNVHPFINQTEHTDLDIVLSNTILGFSNYVKETKPDLIIVHGDRVEALAGALVGSFNNILVAHISGGELTGTIDEFMRHAITKMSHIHFVANNEAKIRLLRMGESKESIFVIGSPEIDAMLSKDLPKLYDVKRYYDVYFEKYAIFCYHPVTTELSTLKHDIKEIVDSLIASNYNYVVIYPNNDPGSDIILEELKRLENNEQFRIFPTMRFEYYLTLLKHCEFIMGNSSSGIREAGIYGVPTINIGTRQLNRSKSIICLPANKKTILQYIKEVGGKKFKPNYEFGHGDSVKKFCNILAKKKTWEIPIQKQFVD